ncbi:MAG: TnpV protein [Clostridia bacterium]|nr:TnpV protein [Clostridia bacterium]
MEITYTEKDGIFYPNLALPEQTNYPIGKYGRMRLEFLKNYRKGTYTTLLTSCKLNEHLHEIEQTAKHQLDLTISQIAKERGIKEELKATNPMCWVQEMNNAKKCAEEIVLNEIVYR